MKINFISEKENKTEYSFCVSFSKKSKKNTKNFSPKNKIKEKIFKE